MSCRCVVGSQKHFLAEISKLFDDLSDPDVSARKDLYGCAAEDALRLTEDGLPTDKSNLSKYATDKSLWNNSESPKKYVRLVEQFGKLSRCMHCRMEILGHVSSFLWTLIPNEYGSKN